MKSRAWEGEGDSTWQEKTSKLSGVYQELGQCNADFLDIECGPVKTSVTIVRVRERLFKPSTSLSMSADCLFNEQSCKERNDRIEAVH